MRLKSLVTRLLLGVMAFALAISCSNPNPTASTPTDTVTEPAEGAQLRVALVTPGAKDDGSWSQGGYEGLQLVEREFNAAVKLTENAPNTEAEGYFREYAAAGYDFVIAHSGGYIESAEKVADEFPRTKFAIVTTYPGNNRNLGAIAFRSGEVGYLSGALAAMTTETNKVAYIVGDNYPVYEEEAALFRKGALATKPEVEVVTEFLKTWTDGEKGKEVVLRLAEQGFDRFAINADEAGIEALKAVTAAYDNVKVVGWTKDQYELAPDQVLTSMLQDMPQLIANSVDLLLQGKWEGKLYKFGLKEGIYSVAPFRGALTAAQEAQFDELKNKVMVGEIDISPS